MQPNRGFPVPIFPLRRAVPINTAPPGYDVSIRNAASARPNELIYQRLQPLARPPGPPVVITLDSDEEDAEPVTKKARKSTNEVDPDDVIFLDSDSEVSDSDSDDVIHIETINRSRMDVQPRRDTVAVPVEPAENSATSHEAELEAELEPEPDSEDDVIHVQTITYSRADDKTRGVGANAIKAVEPKPEPAELPESSHKKDQVLGNPTTPSADKSEFRSGPVLEDKRNNVLEVVPDLVSEPEPEPEAVQVAPGIPVLENKKIELEPMPEPELVPEPEPMPEVVEHPETSHEDTGDEDRAVPVVNPSEILEPESSESEDPPTLLSSQAPETGAALSTDGYVPAEDASSELGTKENQDDELTPDLSSRTEPDIDVLVEVHLEIPSPNASEQAPAEQSESENKESQENQDADTSDNASPRILRSRMSKSSPSHPAKAPEESIYANKKIREGAEYQTVMQPLLEDVPPIVHYDKECEERIWSPRSFETDLFIEETRVVYWKAIWRQFKGRILFEDALQHLMENDYDFAASLETIDQVLKKRPNLMRHPCMAQATRLATHGLKETVSMRRLRKLALPNFQLPEVHHYSFKFLNLCFFSKFYEPKCVCEEALCKPVDFEPRYGCSNCTKRTIEDNPLCLICQTYQQLTGEKRPARDVYFTDEEKELIGKWEQMEEQRLGRNLTREEFEKLLEEEKAKKWRKLEITEEEKLMLNFQHPKTAESYSRMSKKQKAKNFVYYLKPFVLPLFPACKCDQSKERRLMIEKEHLFVPEIPNAPDYTREKEFNPWVDG